MGYLQGLAIGHDWEYEKMQEQDIAFECFYTRKLDDLISDYKNGDDSGVDLFMDDIIDQIYDDLHKSIIFGRLLFCLWSGKFPRAQQEFDRFLGDEIEKRLKKQFKNRVDDE